jgi:2-polyprenyl-3-methyl-5-hydroxy-6-metoxy-1,4-benzoquinol methylase
MILSHLLHNIRNSKVKKYLKGDVLDIGCGPAYFLTLGGNQIKQYYGVDYDATLIAENKKRFPESKFFKKDLDEDTLDINHKFDVIMMIALVEHIFNQKFLFQQAKKCLKPNGIIVITTPTPFGNEYVHKLGGNIGLFSKVAVDDHIVIYNKKRFEILAKELGLKIVKYERFEFGCNQLVVLKKV